MTSMDRSVQSRQILQINIWSYGIVIIQRKDNITTQQSRDDNKLWVFIGIRYCGGRYLRDLSTSENFQLESQMRYFLSSTYLKSLFFGGKTFATWRTVQTWVPLMDSSLSSCICINNGALHQLCRQPVQVVDISRRWWCNQSRTERWINKKKLFRESLLNTKNK